MKIMFLGNLGSGLFETGIGVFLSNDGGVTWTKVSNSPGCYKQMEMVVFLSCFVIQCKLVRLLTSTR